MPQYPPILPILEVLEGIHHIKASTASKPIRVNILIAKKKWEYAIKELEDIPKNDEHLIALKQRVYLVWATSPYTKEKSAKVAKKGLSIPMDSGLENNIPLMINRAKLANMANDAVSLKKIIKKIRQVNPNIDEIAIFEDSAPYWEDDYYPRKFDLEE